MYVCLSVCLSVFSFPVAAIDESEMADTASLEGQLDESDYTEEQQAQNEPGRDDSSVTFSAHASTVMFESAYLF